MAMLSSQKSISNRQAQPLLGPLPFEPAQESPSTQSNPIKRKPVATAAAVGISTTTSLLPNKAGPKKTTDQDYSRLEDASALSAEENEAEEVSVNPSSKSCFFSLLNCRGY